MKEFFLIMKGYIRSQLGKIILGFLIMLIYSVTNIITPFLTQYLIDIVILSKKINLITNFVILSCLVLIILSITGILANYILSVCFENISKEMKFDLYKKIGKNDLRFFDNNKSGEINYRIFSDTDIIQSFFYVLIINIPLDVISIFIISAILLHANATLFLLVFAILILQMLFANSVKKPILKLTAIQRSTAQESNGFLIEFIRYIKLIKGMELEQFTNSNFNNKLSDLKRINIKSTFLNKSVSMVFSLISNLWSIIVLWYGGYLVINNKMSIGSLVSFLMFTGMLYPHISSVFNSFISFQQVKISLKRYLEYSDSDYCLIENGNESKNNKLSEINGNIVFNNVSFGYSDQIEILHNLNFEFRQNEITAIKGANGSGKTTICSLINRFYNSYSGDILIDDMNIKEIPINLLRKVVKYLPQNEYLLSGSIRDNLCAENGDLDSYVIEQSLEKVGLLDFVNNLPSGLNTQVGEAGVQLSGGQAQRLAFARLILLNPKIVILDEPTAFVDAETRKLIRNCLVDFRKKSTVIIVMHSDSILEITDSVLNLS